MSGQEFYRVNELLDRYGLGSRQALYNWLKVLGISLESAGRFSFATPEQVKMIDDLKAHLDNGGTFSNYIPPSDVQLLDTEIDTSLDVSIDSQMDNQPTVVHSPMDSLLTVAKDLLSVDSQLMNQVIKEIDPLWGHRALRNAQEWGLILSTTEVAKLIGVKPYGDVFQRGVWKFTKAGKIGRESGWKISSDS